MRLDLALPFFARVYYFSKGRESKWKRQIRSLFLKMFFLTVSLSPILTRISTPDLVPSSDASCPVWLYRSGLGIINRAPTGQ
jgi:hypothetical protein